MQPNIEINGIKIFNKQTDKKKERKTDRQTDSQTDSPGQTDKRDHVLKKGYQGLKTMLKNQVFPCIADDP